MHLVSRVLTVLVSRPLPGAAFKSADRLVAGAWSGQLVNHLDVDHIQCHVAGGEMTADFNPVSTLG